MKTAHPRLNVIAAWPAFAALALASIQPAFASGSDSFSTTSSATGQYNAGKRVFAERLACDGCMFAGKSIDKEIAMKVVSDPKATEALSADEKEVVVAYAKKRFRL
jgi:hypothetical protein